jgi:choline dehydrogenase-like flavoprotein
MYHLSSVLAWPDYCTAFSRTSGPSWSDANNINNVRIAVVERGEKVHGKTPQNFQHDHESTTLLRDLFTAAHYSSCPGADHSISSPTTLNTFTPQRHLHLQVLDVPTGRGWGGSTNIHAGLLVPPSQEDFQSWPGTWKGRMMHASCLLLLSRLQILFH